MDNDSFAETDTLGHPTTRDIVLLLQRWMNGQVNYSLRHDTRQAIQSLENSNSMAVSYLCGPTGNSPSIQNAAVDASSQV